jgi:predicted phage terminase large subunit-like protein
LTDGVAPEQLAALPADQLAYMAWQQRWAETARPDQVMPTSDWTECGVLAGRGYGKTRVGAEWLGETTFRDTAILPAAVIAPTQADVRFTCFEGESGLLNVIPPECVGNYNRTDLLLTLTNGATIRGFSAEKADRLRGPQHVRVWCDELAAWGKDAEDTWDMMQFGLRLGRLPQALWTTTPKPVPIVRRLTTPQAGRIIIRGSTFDNKANLPDSFFKALEQYEGTKIGRQELYGELIDPEEAGIVRRSWIQIWPAKKPLPKLDWIIMSLDTAYTEKTLDKKGDPDPTACDVIGIFSYANMTHAMLLDSWDDHLGLPDLMRRVKKELNTAYGDDEDTALIKPLFGSAKPQTSGRKPDILLIEDKGSGISLRQMLERERIEAYAYNPGRADKLSRLHVVSPIFAQRRFWVPESEKHPGKPRTWCDAAITQLCSFTGENSIKHDDHVDAVSQALRLMMDKNMLRLVKDPKPTHDDRPPPGPYKNPYAA